MIRRFEPEDAEKVSSLIRNTLMVSNARDYDVEVILNLQKIYSPHRLLSLAQTREIYVYEKHRRMFGTISLEGETIYSFFVSPDRQNEGIGTAMMEFLEETIRKRGGSCLHIDASLTAVPFYRRRGFLVTGTRGDGRFGRTVHMRKLL